MTGQKEPRDTARYHLKEGNKIIHTGITNDPERREAEHQQERPNSRLEQQGPKVTRASAEEWERQQTKGRQADHRLPEVAQGRARARTLAPGRSK